MSVTFVNIQLHVRLKHEMKSFELAFHPTDSHRSLRIWRSEEELAGALHEVSDDPHNVAGLEVLGGVTADDEVVGGLDLICHNVVNLKPPVSVAESLPVVVDIRLHDVKTSERHVRSFRKK